MELPKNVPSGLVISLPTALYINLDLSDESCIEGTDVALDNLNVLLEGVEVGTVYINTSTKDVFRCTSKSDSECVWTYMANTSAATPSTYIVNK